MLDFSRNIGHAIMAPLYYAVSVRAGGFHKLFSTFLDPAGGAAWVLSIVGLTLVIRAALIPLFVKQIKSQPQHAADPAQGAGAAEEVRPRPREARRRRR